MKQKKKSHLIKVLKMVYFTFGAVAVLNAAMKEIKAKEEQAEK